MKYKDKKWLEEQVSVKSVAEIAAELECGEITIYRWMKKLEIEKEKPLYQNKSWLNEQLKTKGSAAISEELGVDIHTISRWIKKFGLTRDTPLYQEKDWLEEKLKECNGSLKTISEKYGYKRDTINEWCLKHGLSKEKRNSRTYKLKENYFSQIDTSNKSYWVGLLMADGFMDREIMNFGIGLHHKDEDILVKFAEDIGYNGKIFDHYSGFKNEIENTIPYKYLLVCSTAMAKDLNYHGIIPNKTGKESLPETIPDEFIRDFIRAFLDGDGCIDPSNNRIEFYSPSYNVLLSIKEHLESKIQIKEYEIRRKKDHKKPYFVYSVYGKNAVKLGKYLYDDAELFLNRKRELFNEILNKPRFTEM